MCWKEKKGGVYIVESEVVYAYQVQDTFKVSYYITLIVPLPNETQRSTYASEKNGCSCSSGTFVWRTTLAHHCEIDSAFLSFFFPCIFKNVCDAAGKFSGQNTAAFRNYWHARLGCQFHHSLAALSIRRSLVFRQKLLRSHTDDTIIDNILQPQMELPVYSVGPVLLHSALHNSIPVPFTGVQLT